MERKRARNVSKLAWGTGRQWSHRWRKRKRRQGPRKLAVGLGSEESRRRMLLVDGNVRSKSLLRGSGEPGIFWRLLPKLLPVAPTCLYDLGVESEFQSGNISLHDHRVGCPGCTSSSGQFAPRIRPTDAKWRRTNPDPPIYFMIHRSIVASFFPLDDLLSSPCQSMFSTIWFELIFLDLAVFPNQFGATALNLSRLPFSSSSIQSILHKLSRCQANF